MIEATRLMTIEEYVERYAREGAFEVYDGEIKYLIPPINFARHINVVKYSQNFRSYLPSHRIGSRGRARLICYFSPPCVGSITRRR